MRKLSVILFSLLSLFLCSFAHAQISWVPGDAVAPKYGLPGPICATDLNYLMTTEPYSSGDQHNGFIFGWSFAKHCFTIEPPKLLVGPGNLPVDTTLTPSNSFVFLDGAIGSGGGTGFRAGAQYVPQGVYMVWGIYEILTSSTSNSRIEIQISVGNGLSTGLQATILAASPAVIGGGATTCVTANSYCQVTVFAPKVQCGAGYGQSCEIRFAAVTTNGGDVVKVKSPSLPTNIVSANGVLRVGGPDNLQ